MAVIEDISQLSCVGESLLAKEGVRNFFFSRPWFEIYLDTVAARNDQIRIFEEEDLETESCLVFLAQYERGNRPWNANNLSSLANYYTCHFKLLSNAKDETEKALIDRLVMDIGKHHPRIDIARISPLDSDAPGTGLLQEAFRQHGWWTEQYFCFRNLFEPVDGLSFSEYLSRRSSRVRKTAANRSRKFDRDSSNRFEIIKDAASCRIGIDLFCKLYEKRWGRSEPYPQFVPRLIAECAERGWLRLGLAWVGGRAAAAQLWIVKDRVAYIFKVAYDPEFDNLSIGSVTLFKMFEAAIDVDDVAEIDFLSGDDVYKRDWVGETRDKCGVAAYRRDSLQGLYAAARNLGPRFAKSISRRTVSNSTKDDVSAER